jgi:translation elongation factor P/translation initiation factor 5A
MGYLLIKKDDVKTFKSFLSGNEIEVGVRVDSQANIFSADDEVYVFYGNDDTDTYKARITRQKRASGNTAFLLLGVVKDTPRSNN